MSDQKHPADKSGILIITGGVHSEEAARAIKAGLEDTPGVRQVAFTREGVRIRFNGDLADEQKFYEAVKVVGYHASDFRTLG